MVDTVSKTINTQIRKKLSDGTYQVEHPETTIENVLGKATKEEAEEGTDNTKYMTPLRTIEAIDSRIANGSYNGNGSSSRNISVGFKPALVICKMSHSGMSAGHDAGILLGPDALILETSDTVLLDRGVSINDNGFTVGGHLNSTNRSYDWIAI